MMNKNLPAYLYHVLMERGLPEEFMQDLLEHSCEATLLADRHRCKWDTATKTLTMAEDNIEVEKAKDFEGAAWFRDEFGLLGKNASRNEARYVPPEALFNLDDAGSRKTIHDRHKKVHIEESANIFVGTPPRQVKKKSVVDMTGDEEDSASSKSSDSEKSLSSSDERSRFQASSNEDDSAMSVTGGG